MKLPQWLAGLFARKKRTRLSPESIESLRAEFKIRHHNFQLVLGANNKALELMGEIEEALGGSRPFGMNFVRAKCCRIAASVYQMIKHLDEICPEKYDPLFEKIIEIINGMRPHLDYNPVGQGRELVLPIDEVDRGFVDRVGGKMANLGEMKSRLNLNVPGGFVVTAHGFWSFLRHESLDTAIEKTIQSMESDEFDYLFHLSEVVQHLVQNAPLPVDLERAILEGYRSLEEVYGRNVSVALRSSSPVEDLPGMSMAGQYHTELGITGEDIIGAYKKVVASKYGYQSMVLRLNLGIRDDDVAMCVGVMPMVDAASGGVVYTKDPLLPEDDDLAIYSVFGLPKLVVDGSAASDHFVVARDEPMRVEAQEIAHKEQMCVFAADHSGCLSKPTGEIGSDPSLTETKVLELAELALSIESHYGSAQDIEWALDPEGSIVILQSRPLATKSPRRRREVDTEEHEDEPVVLRGGVTASPGRATGSVFVIRNEQDVMRFPEGSVLVSSLALPLYAVLLGKAAAVVAESGSVAGHLASVSREFGVPALFGVEGAVGALADEKLITVDADEKKILSGRVGTPSLPPKPPISHIQGSPVYESLKGISELIIPLNLLDPDGADFKPHKCRTVHDITRFCHEKAVKEMFAFGREQRFIEHSSKQLLLEKPMQFWIIDLDDGFSESAPADDRYIRLEHITSIPMRALWEGMTAVQWRGPPPVNTRGLMSVMFQATANPELLSSRPSEYSNRNYFMITKNFVSLQSRFGAHFSSVEALFGEREAESYLSFVFKGGATSIERRVLRAKLVAEILEEQGFHTRLIQDSVSARVEGFPSDKMEPKLRVVGYLTVHTRQLDMAMNGPASFSKHKKKISNDIGKMLSV